MNKNQGTTLGAVILAAFMMRGAGVQSTPPDNKVNESSAASSSAFAGQHVVGEGPWIASCSYWAADREFEGDEDIEPPVDAEVEVHQRQYVLKGHLVSEERSGDCKGSQSGEPDKPDMKKWGMDGKEVTSIIALVPNPILTSMPLRFDRDIDALTSALAASNTRYLTTYYWIPWQESSGKSGTSKSEEPSTTEKKKQHEPGLIIFREATKETDPNAKRSDLERAPLYVFLVGESPTSGIDGLQMQKALAYRRAMIRERADVSSKPLYVIGPNFSGSAPSLERALHLEKEKWGENVSVRGITGAASAAQFLSKRLGPDSYLSFDENADFSQDKLVSLLRSSGVPASEIAVLQEDGTAFGMVNVKDVPADEPDEPAGKPDKPADKPDYLDVHYPRNIYLLRNAYATQHISSSNDAAPPSPYLQLNLKGNNSNSFDEVPNFDSEMMPLSQESQLMAIQRQLERYRTQYILISSTNVLDQIFLAQYFHRAMPDARLVFDSGDLLFEREVEDVPFIGTLTINPYHLIGLANSSRPGFGGFASPSSDSNAYYNASAWVVCELDGATCTEDNLIGYKTVFPHGAGTIRPPLWVTAIGSDGYYPVGIAAPEPSTGPLTLPAVATVPGLGERVPLHPSRPWLILCLMVAMLCLGHTVLIFVADYWSPFTRSLAIWQNDDPRRLLVYIHIGTAMLWSMAWVVAWPLFACRGLLSLSATSWMPAAVTLLFGFAAIVVTIRRSLWVLRRRIELDEPISAGKACVRPDSSFYMGFSTVACATMLLITAMWVMLCGPNPFVPKGSNAGLFFAYRCLNPQSGVSPVTPVLLLLATWYLWAIIHSLRHRFSMNSRPLLPLQVVGMPAETSPSYPLYVSDEALGCNPEIAISPCLYRNITCLLITRDWIFRFLRKKRPDFCIGADIVLMFVYLCGFIAAILIPSMHTLDRMFWQVPPEYWILQWMKDYPQLGITPYELLNRALFFPLLIVVLTSWLRMIFIWGSFKRGLLQPLENSPLRFAFDSLKGSGWISMFRQSGVKEQWKDMSRTTESIRHILHHPEFDRMVPSDEDRCSLTNSYDRLNYHISSLIKHIRSGETEPRESKYMRLIEMEYQWFSTNILRVVLIKYWWNKKYGLVDSNAEKSDLCKALHDCFSKHDADEKHEGDESSHDGGKTGTGEAEFIKVAEEFLAIRYVAVIRAVLVNLRFLMFFIVACFVLTIVSWNSYPFEPRQFINWIFTILLIFLGFGIVSVLAQMFRDPLLSRIANKKPNELGLEFYVKLISLGILPLLSWLAYNYPELGSTLFKVIQPGVSVVK